MKHLITFSIAFLLIFPCKGWTQEKYNLQTLLKQAVENNSEIKKATYQESESKYKTKEVMAHGLPQIEGGINYTRMGIPKIDVPDDLAAILPQDLYPLLMKAKDIDALHIVSTGVTVSQLLYSESYRTGIRQSKKAEELFDLLVQKTEDEVIYEVASMYYLVINDYSTLEVLDEIIATLEKIRSILDLQYENDFVKKTDVSRLKVQIANLKTKRNMLCDGIAIRERVLKIMCGIPLETNMVIDTAMAVKENIIQPEITPFELEKLSLFRLMQKQQELAGLQIKTDQAAYYPSLAVFGQFNLSSYTTQFNLNSLSGINTVGFKANIPLFSSGLRHSKVMQSKLKLQEFNEDFQTNIKQLGTGYQNASNTMLSSWESLQDQQQNKTLAHEVYSQVKLGFDEGMASLTDLLNVESSLLDAENLYNQQLLKYRIAWLDVKKSTDNLPSILEVKQK